MSARKSERLLNLLITLLVARTYVTKERLRQAIPDYQGSSDEAFGKMFERDKDDLRQLGIPIEVGSHDAFFDDEPGYRIPRAAFELPEIALEADEAAVVGLAARVWQHAGLASATSDALIKLKAAGVDVDRARLDVVQPQLVADEPTFEAVFEAVRTRTPIRFGYRRASEVEAAPRHLQPWGAVTYRGRWYVVGHDTDRDAVRMFRLSRIEGEVRPAGRPGSFQVPEGTDLRALTRALATPPRDRTAVLLVRDGAAHGLRRRMRRADGDAPEGFARVRVRFSGDGSFLGEVLSYGADVVVLEPGELRAQVRACLSAMAGEGAS